MLDTIISRITAVKYTELIKPSSSPRWATMRATSPRVIMPTPMRSESLLPKRHSRDIAPQPMTLVAMATITNSTEGIEATVINVYGGDIDVTASDDGINAANGDGVYEGELEYSYNQMGGDVTIHTSADGIDSNGNVNLIDGSAAIQSAANGGDAGIDYDGDLYISEDYNLNNASGVAGPDNMMGMPGQLDGMNGQPGGAPTGMGGMNGQPGGMGGR